jgi:xanthine dehydrogenase accessory factor
VPPEGGRWLAPLTSWPATLCAWLTRDAAPVIRVLVAGSRGSVPREPGACMLVAAGASAGTIGGGHLEWRACAAARALLADPDPRPPVRLAHLVLGAELAQCCGGTVQLWIERFTQADLPLLSTAAAQLTAGVPVLISTDIEGGSVTRRLLPAQAVERVRLTESTRLIERVDPAVPLWLYGAGHVGQALVRVLDGLPFEITWIDSRADLFPHPLRAHVRTLSPADPVKTVDQAPAGARFLVMTHDHALDYALCRAILRRGARAPGLAWLGLIGSRSKAARFRSHLRRDGLGSDLIAQLTCPIGMTVIDSKLPAAIAVGIAARLLADTGTAAVEHTGAQHDVPHETGPCGAPTCAVCAETQTPSDRARHRDA